jgi:hypothetical protein
MTYFGIFIIKQFLYEKDIKTNGIGIGEIG